ncbi:MAG: DUF3783 domain-containing protein [Clostridia bacterium]|nr:DUF3783 domain-containing protein [Clostridia bacterium]
MQATVLCYHLSEEKEKAITEALALLGVKIRRVTAEELGQTVGCLAGVEDMEMAKSAGEPPVTAETEVLVMCGFTQMQFNLFMALFQRKKIPPVGLKAMLTPTNQEWTFAKLVGELQAEHALMTRQNQGGKKSSGKNEKK